MLWSHIATSIFKLSMQYTQEIVDTYRKPSRARVMPHIKSCLINKQSLRIRSALQHGQREYNCKLYSMRPNEGNEVSHRAWSIQRSQARRFEFTPRPWSQISATRSLRVRMTSWPVSTGFSSLFFFEGGGGIHPVRHVYSSRVIIVKQKQEIPRLLCEKDW